MLDKQSAGNDEAIRTDAALEAREMRRPRALPSPRQQILLPNQAHRTIIENEDW